MLIDTLLKTHSAVLLITKKFKTPFGVCTIIRRCLARSTCAPNYGCPENIPAGTPKGQSGKVRTVWHPGDSAVCTLQGDILLVSLSKCL